MWATQQVYRHDGEMSRVAAGNTDTQPDYRQMGAAILSSSPSSVDIQRSEHMLIALL